ncbi:MAG: MBL fold metallo-hydrolase [Candidatus Aenigmatarchaeota archaeon]|nr:MAG: MBL fold metallo-hydrolase [Candidatus Aenigmarchaeota archaeon]
MPRNITIGDVDIEWLGHASFRFKADNKIIYVDPFKISGGEKADIILITHDHYDHCDPGSINSVKKQDTLIIAPESCSSKIPDMRAVKPGDVVSVKDVEIKAVHAYNIGKPYHPKGNGVGFVVKIVGKTIYHAGDTDKIPEMDNLKNIDVALLPAGGTYTMNAEEAAEAANTIEPAVAIPMHWGKIVGSEQDAAKFKDLCKVQVRVLD